MRRNTFATLAALSLTISLGCSGPGVPALPTNISTAPAIEPAFLSADKATVMVDNSNKKVSLDGDKPVVRLATVVIDGKQGAIYWGIRDSDGSLLRVSEAVLFTDTSGTSPTITRIWFDDDQRPIKVRVEHDYESGKLGDTAFVFWDGDNYHLSQFNENLEEVAQEVGTVKEFFGRRKLQGVETLVLAGAVATCMYLWAKFDIKDRYIDPAIRQGTDAWDAFWSDKPSPSGTSEQVFNECGTSKFRTLGLNTTICEIRATGFPTPVAYIPDFPVLPEWTRRASSVEIRATQKVNIKNGELVYESESNYSFKDGRAPESSRVSTIFRTDSRIHKTTISSIKPDSVGMSETEGLPFELWVLDVHRLEGQDILGSKLYFASKEDAIRAGRALYNFSKLSTLYGASIDPSIKDRTLRIAPKFRIKTPNVDAGGVRG